MTLSDLLCYLRAKKGGVFYSDVTEAVEIPTLRLVRAERTLSISDLTVEELSRLAEYFEVPVEELRDAQRQLGLERGRGIEHDLGIERGISIER